MDNVLNNNSFFVKEHVGMFKAANNYDILDPNSQQIILECREDNLGMLTKFLRFTGLKTNTPFNIELRLPSGKRVLTIKRGISLFLSNVEVFDENEQLLGMFKQKLLSIGGKFEVNNPQGEFLCTLKGKWTSWEFRFIKDDMEFAKVTKKWSGFGKEMFTTADNYILEINDSVPKDDKLRPLILSAVMCIDMVLKEE